MNTIFLLLIFFAVNIGTHIFTKLTSKQVNGPQSGDHVIFFFIINSIVASIFFFAIGGCRPRFDLTSLLYSLLYALIIFLVTFSTIKALQSMAIWRLNLLLTSCTMTFTCLIGFLAFSEDITVIKLLRIFLILVALCLTVLPATRKKTEKKPVKKWLFLYLFGLILGSVGNYLTLKAFAESDTVSSDNDFFLLSNLVVLAFALLYVLWRHRSNKGKKHPPLGLKPLIIYSGNTLSSNVFSLLSLLLIARMEASVYQPTAAAIELLGAFSASLLFLEKQHFTAYLAVIPALIAVII